KGTVLCAGQSTTLTASASGGTGPYTYTWNATTTIATHTVNPAVTTTYTLQVTDANGCTAAPVLVTVRVNALPNVLFMSDSLNGCYPLCMKFTDQTTMASGKESSWQWNFGDGGTSSSQNPSYCYQSPGVYTVSLIVTSDSGCVSKLIIPKMITVYDHPHANFSASPQPANILQPFVQFADMSTDAY